MKNVVKKTGSFSANRKWHGAAHLHSLGERPMGKRNKDANENSSGAGIAVYDCLASIWDWTEMEIEDKQSIPHYYPATCTQACCDFSLFIFYFFKPPSVYCERLISACVCYSGSITGCALILNFCPSYFHLFFLHSVVYILLKCFPLCCESLENESPSIEVVKWITKLSQALFVTATFFILHLLLSAEGVLISVNSTTTFLLTCNYCHVYLYLKHCSTRKISQ